MKLKSTNESAMLRARALPLGAFLTSVFSIFAEQVPRKVMEKPFDRRAKSSVPSRGPQHSDGALRLLTDLLFDLPGCCDGGLVETPPSLLVLQRRHYSQDPSRTPQKTRTPSPW